jgi:hypothetical protein
MLVWNYLYEKGLMRWILDLVMIPHVVFLIIVITPNGKGEKYQWSVTFEDLDSKGTWLRKGNTMMARTLYIEDNG